MIVSMNRRNVFQTGSTTDVKTSVAGLQIKEAYSNLEEMKVL